MPSSTKAELVRNVAEHADTLFDLRRRLAVLEERDARRDEQAERQQKENDELRRKLYAAQSDIAVLRARADSNSRMVNQVEGKLYHLVLGLLAVPMFVGVAVTVSRLLG